MLAKSVHQIRPDRAYFGFFATNEPPSTSGHRIAAESGPWPTLRDPRSEVFHLPGAHDGDHEHDHRRPKLPPARARDHRSPPAAAKGYIAAP
jgi:hypothetical protein